MFLAANIGYSVYNKWLAPTYTVSADDIVQAKAQQFTQDQKQIAEAQDAERVATTAKETADRTLDDANRQIAGLQAKLATAASQPSVSPPAQPQIQPERLSPEDIATKLSIWDSVGARNVNVLEDAYNNMNNAFKRWPGLIDSTEERQQLHNDIVNFTAAYVKASNDLEVLRSEYPQYTDVSSSLSQPHLATLVKASSDFINAVDGSAGDTPASLELKLRPLAGALRREMDATQSWILALHRIADQKHAELSK